MQTIIIFVANMQRTDIFRTYTWLINAIRRAGKITFSDLNKEWIKTELSNGVSMYRSSFNRYRDAILDSFGIVIECDPRTYEYYIENGSVLSEDSIQNWMLSTLSVNNVIKEGMSLQNRIFLESMPHSRHLETMVEAMKKSRKVLISYKKYGTEELTQRVVEPYFLKAMKRRWYVLTKNDLGEFRLFSFDRIVDAHILAEEFVVDKEFDAKEYFSDSYGVMKDERVPPQRIILRAFGNEKHYMNDLPVHHSQRVLRVGDGYVDYEIYMRPTTDFVGYLMSRGTWCRVMEPASLVEQLHDALRKAAGMYDDSNSL